MSLIENKAKLFLKENPALTLENIANDSEVRQRIVNEVAKYSPHELGEIVYEAGDLPPVRWGNSGVNVLRGIAEHKLAIELKRLLKV